MSIRKRIDFFSQLGARVLTEERTRRGLNYKMLGRSQETQGRWNVECLIKNSEQQSEKLYGDCTWAVLEARLAFRELSTGMDPVDMSIKTSTEE